MEKFSKKTFLDTNYILRYILEDDEIQSKEATECIDKSTVFITNEVICEVCYVLESVYEIKRSDINKAIHALLLNENIEFEDNFLIDQAFNLYASKKLDIVDCILFTYYKLYNSDIKTFDKKLSKLIREN